LLLPLGEVGRGQDYIKVNHSNSTRPPKFRKAELLAGASSELLAHLIGRKPHLEAILLLPLGEVGRGQDYIKVNHSNSTRPPKFRKAELLACARLELVELLIGRNPHLEAILLLPLGEVGRGQDQNPGLFGRRYYKPF
jgi:hypothetical protein